MAGEEPRRKAVIKYVGGLLAALVLVCGFVYLVKTMMALKISKPERQVQTIQLIKPPPPPPPDQPPPPPPPPPEKIEQQLPQDKPDPTPDQPEQQAPDVLANDGPASAGSDSFGMHQGSGGGVLGGTGTAPFAWYTDKMRDVIKDKLSNTSCVKSAKGSISTRIVVGADGRVKHIELTTTTGNPRLDECVDTALASITRVGAEPPPGMPEAINLRVVF
jgi:periplasmic protein TonB